MALTLRINGDEINGFTYQIVNPALEGLPSYVVEFGDFGGIYDVIDILEEYRGRIDVMADRSDTPRAWERRLVDKLDQETFSTLARRYGIHYPVLRG